MASSVEAAEDEEDSETEQAVWNGSSWDSEGETIMVQGGLDLCWTGLCWPTSWPTTNPGPGHIGEDGGGGGGGHGSGVADPHPIPAPRDCTAEPTHEQCYACCDWNVDEVWGERCRRIKDRGERKRCWADAENRRGDCQRGCPRLTITRVP